jgi:hypothetical protein
VNFKLHQLRRRQALPASLQQSLKFLILHDNIISSHCFEFKQRSNQREIYFDILCATVSLLSYNSNYHGIENLAAGRTHSEHNMRSHDARLRNLVRGGPLPGTEGFLRDSHTTVHACLRDVLLSQTSMLSVVIVTAEFKFSKVVEHFKFLQFLPGLALFNLLYSWQ